MATGASGETLADLGRGGGDAHFGRALVLVPARERDLLRGEAGLGLGDLLAGGAVVDPDEEVAGLHHVVVLHQHLGDVAGDLRREGGDLAAHLGVLGHLDRAGKGRQPPGVEHEADPGEAEKEGDHGRGRAEEDAGVVVESRIVPLIRGARCWRGRA